MDIFKILNLERTPLPLALFLYLFIAIIIVKIKPSFLFESPENTEDEDLYGYKKDKTIWMFFLILAILIYAVVSSFVSSKIKSNYCADLKSKSLKEIMEMSKCKI